MNPDLLSRLPGWLTGALLSGVLVSQIATALGVGYLVFHDGLPALPDNLPAAPLPPVQAVNAPPASALTDAIAEGWVQEEATRLLRQAEKDVQEPGNPCYGQSPACPLGHYGVATEVRRQALAFLKSDFDDD